MSWLRLDDGYDTHPKLAELTELERWRWTRVLLSCARHTTNGRVTPATLRELRIGAPTIAKPERAELLHPLTDGAYEVHDFAIYNGATLEDRVYAFCKGNPGATANDAYRAVGGNRGTVLQLFAQYQQTSQNTGTTPSTTEPQQNHQAGALAVPSHTCGPHPHPLGTTASNEAAAPTNAAAAAAANDHAGELAAAGWTHSQLERAQGSQAELDRAVGLLAEARADASVRRPGALAWQRFEAGAVVGTSAPVSSVANGAQGERSRSRLLPFGPCAVDGCDHRAVSEAALEEHRRNVHGVGEPVPVAPPAALLALAGRSGGSREPVVDLDDDEPASAGEV